MQSTKYMMKYEIFVEKLINYGTNERFLCQDLERKNYNTIVFLRAYNLTFHISQTCTHTPYHAYIHMQWVLKDWKLSWKCCDVKKELCNTVKCNHFMGLMISSFMEVLA